jgi:DnaJ-class molecular chaperone
MSTLISHIIKAAAVGTGVLEAVRFSRVNVNMLISIGIGWCDAALEQRITVETLQPRE